MAKTYQKLPSEILRINDEYTAYCFDEVAHIIFMAALDNNGDLKWNRIRWEDDTPKSNKDFIEHVQKYQKT